MAQEDDIESRRRARRGRILAGISTNVLVLGLVSFLTDMSSEMIYPIMPLFLSLLGAGGLVIGLIEGAAETTASLLKVVSGWYSDRHRRRKPFITAGYGISAFVKPLFYLSTTPWHVLGIRITERVGKGIRSAPRDALIAESTDPTVRGKAFGIHKAMDAAGAVIGPLLVLPVFLYAAAVTEDTYRLIFLLSAIPALIAVAVIVMFVKDSETAMTGRIVDLLGEMRALPRAFWLLMVPVVAFYIGEVNVAFFILKGNDAGLDDAAIILLYVLFNLMFVLIAIPSGIYSDTLGRRPVIVASFAIYIVTCMTMAAAESLLLLAVGFALYGFYKGTSEGVLKAYVVDFIDPKSRGTALGAFHTCVGLVMLPGGVIAGLLWDSVAPWATFAYGIVVSLAALALLAALGPRKDLSRPRPL